MRYFIILFIVTIMACNTTPHNHVIIQKLPNTQKLHGYSTTKFDNEFGIIALYTTENYYICQSHRTDYHFFIYNKKDTTKIGDLCPKGRGANEFIAPIYLSQYVLENQETKIWILDRATSRFYKINIDKSIKENKTYIEKSISIRHYHKNYVRELFQLNDTLFLGTDDQHLCKHFLLNTRDSVIQYLEADTKFAPAINPFTIFQNVSTYNVNSKQIATSYFCLPKINFINVHSKSMKIIHYKTHINPLKITQKQENEEFFHTICSNPQFVFALYNHESNENKSSILVFTWEGNPVCEYIIPYATHITFDQTKNTIIAININKEKEIVTLYPLTL